VDSLTEIAVPMAWQLSTYRSKTFLYGPYEQQNMIAVVLVGIILFSAYVMAREALFTPARQDMVDL
jgi:hypothetical protein